MTKMAKRPKSKFPGPDEIRVKFPDVERLVNQLVDKCRPDVSRSFEADMPIVSKYIRYLADNMRLKDWTFEVEFDGELQTSLATVECVQNRRHARIAVGPLFFTSSPEDQRHGAVHELVHCHLQPASTFFSRLQSLGEAHETLSKIHEDHLESSTDALAAAIATGLKTMKDFEKDKA